MPSVAAAVVARASLVIMNSSTFDDVLAYMFDYVGQLVGATQNSQTQVS